MATLNANRMLGHSLPPIPQSTAANHWEEAKQFAAYGALNGFNKQVNKREIQKFAFVCMARRNERVRN